ncbi:MAG: hypothetical protein FRX48_07349 [Lasallia pustulata]|uniref:Uncharacterized protein n=1 Tax=Lasallia pustulata TaxID=136370 RepID=A0A5M8PI72_9LECA|nr:MAG: hypothetical protein FRX48_07349 [Lasallia pustulata]
MVKWLNEQRADNREENKDGTSSLGVAAQFGHLEVAKWLKEQGVDAHNNAHASIRVHKIIFC